MPVDRRVTPEKKEKIIHLLKTTEMVFKAIASRMSVSEAAVGRINKEEKIRRAQDGHEFYRKNFYD